MISTFWDLNRLYTTATGLGLQEPHFCKSFTSLEALSLFINMLKYTYINVSTTFLAAFLTFGSLPKHLHCAKS